MDTSTCSLSNQNVSQTSAQRKFYQWVLKWINGLNANAETNGEELRDTRYPSKPDILTFASLLQAIGFKLLSFEKENTPLVSKNSESNGKSDEQSVLRISIECNTSKMKAIFELEDITCQCPNPDHVKEASFWSISGTAPVGSTDNIVHKVEQTGSNLLPRLSKDVSRVLHDVSYRLFDTIACEPDVNRNPSVCLNVPHATNSFCDTNTIQSAAKKEIGFSRSSTQPEIRRRAYSTNSKFTLEKQRQSINNDTSPNYGVTATQEVKPNLQRQRTWDIDIETGSLNGEPRPSPPKLSSSPAVVAELSQSLGQISLQSETEYPRSVTEYILGAQQNLEKALQILLFKKPSISTELSHDDDSSVKSVPVNLSPPSIVNSYQRARSNTISTIRPSPRECTSKQQPQIKTNMVHAPKSRRSVDLPFTKTSTRRSLTLEQESFKTANRRNSFYVPSANSNISLLSKSSNTGINFLGSTMYSTSKTNLMVDPCVPNRDSKSTRKIASPENQMNTSQNNRTSYIKPPSKIARSIPVKTKSITPSKISTGIVKKSRINLLNE